jgi:CubicO group peptidase (beta-lactamase class C family)
MWGPERPLRQASRTFCIASGDTSRVWRRRGAYGTQFFCDPKERLVVVVGTAAPGELRKYYREQVQDLVYGAMVK